MPDRTAGHFLLRGLCYFVAGAVVAGAAGEGAGAGVVGAGAVRVWPTVVAGALLSPTDCYRAATGTMRPRSERPPQ